MKVVITKRNNGIHRYLQMDVENLGEKDDLLVLADLIEVVSTYNKDQVEKA